MRFRPFIVLLTLLAMVASPAVGLAQTPTPREAAGACAPATPCTEAGAGAGLSLASVAVQAEAPAVDVAAQTTTNSGFGLAWAVMALLVLALLYAILAAVFATLGRAFPVLPAGAQLLVPILSVLGLGVAFYLTYVETQNVAAVCGPVGDCNAVQASPFAKLFGFLPVGLLGLLGYVGIIAAWLVARRTPAQSGLNRLAALAVFGMALFGVLFTIYLTYLELFVIHAVCIWCLTSAVLMAVILGLSVGPALEALQTEVYDEEEYGALR